MQFSNGQKYFHVAITEKKMYLKDICVVFIEQKIYCKSEINKQQQH